jgi:hypothetical protein
MKRILSLVLMLGVPAVFVSAKPPFARCPNIHKAVGALEAAMHDMQVAAHDFCGHKDEAMEAARRAIEQLRKAEECKECEGGDRR